MTPEHKVFDVATSPLERAVHLIEASAGTGKTYAIAMLVLRFITEFSLKIEDILLVTFTRAATEELGERIRLRLVEGRQLLEGSANKPDATLLSWKEKITDPDQALLKIKTALIDIDRAQIFTIHGFCQRMLQEQALESSQLFDVELLPDNEKVLRSVVQDFWRLFVYSLPERQCGVVLGNYAAPEQLHQSVAPLSSSIAAVEPQTEDLQEITSEFDQNFEKFSSWWKNNADTLYESLQTLISEGKTKKKFTENFPTWWQALSKYFEKESYNFPEGLHLLHPENFAGEINGTKVRGAKKTELLKDLLLPEENVGALLDNVSRLLLSLRKSYTQYYLEEIERRMVEHNAMSYDDLIVRLQRAVQGASAAHLLNLLRQRFQAAVIDEFQDTDTLQWQIFSTVFKGGRHFLYLIGDPKQAIYKFRGADIHSYFLAKKSADQILTLKRNYRSHPGCVAAVNALFSSREHAFLYEESMLDFTPVDSALKNDDHRLERGGEALGNMVFCQLERTEGSKDGTWTSAKAAAAIMRYVTSEIVALLQTNINIVSKAENGVEERLLQPKDIAILVRQNDHAEQYQKMLAQAGVAAVLASRSSVFQTVECNELYILLRALTDPDDIVLLKRAMAVSWMGLNGNELYRIWQDEHVFNRYFSRFQGYAELWKTQGVLIMLKHLFETEKVFITLAAGERAERKIANLIHLMELIQRAQDENMYGPIQLLQWLRRSIDSPTGEDELRLESDDDAVRIVTMHGAKGLEYPVVFCPSLWYRQTRLEKETQRVAYHEDGMFKLDLGSEQFDIRRQKALQEDMAEDLRLCYVALTRAKLRCYIMWCDYKGIKGSSADSFYSGIGYLLFPQGRISFAEQQQTLVKKKQEKSCRYRLIKAETELPHHHQAAVPTPSNFILKKRLRAPLVAERQMTSYSALASAGQHSDKHDDEFGDTADTGMNDNRYSGEKIPFAALPSGANFGNVVHDVLESIPFTDLRNPQEKQHLIMQICRKYGVEADFALLSELLKRVVTAPLGSTDASSGQCFSLASLEPEKCVKEMGFYFHLRNGSTEDINRLLAAEKTVSDLSARRIAGFLTGFVDLIFEHNNLFYIIDYKTNNLGEYGEDYSADRLVEGMAAHNYGLQYYLYSLVLHRYLKNCKPGYNYTAHFGGVFYLFVRGMSEDHRGIYFHKPDLQTLENLGNCFGE